MDSRYTCFTHKIKGKGKVTQRKLLYSVHLITCRE